MTYPRFFADRAGRATTAQWITILLLGTIVLKLWFKPFDNPIPAAWAQAPPMAGARGVFAFSGPISRDQYGLFMMDVDQGTIWCYAFENVSGTSKLRLVAARTWLYDRYLQDFNCAAPDFRMVQTLVAQQRAPVANPAEPGATADGAPDGPKPRREP